MKPIRYTALPAVFLAISGAALAADNPSAQSFWETPALVGVGPVHALPQAAYQPRPQDTYNIVFSITQAAAAPNEVNPSLGEVARLVNLYTSAGVPLSHLSLVAVIHGQAIDATLDDEHYRQKYSVANPNLGLIKTLRSAGVDVTAGGQSIANREEQYDWIAPQVTLTLSGLTTITNLQHQGYVLMPL
jgi:intracellular sulfur oxidation DsrE/DsrF family protein